VRSFLLRHAAGFCFPFFTTVIGANRGCVQRVKFCIHSPFSPV
jgi:hypothetical protein